jgi:hypothetical protein
LNIFETDYAGFVCVSVQLVALYQQLSRRDGQINTSARICFIRLINPAELISRCRAFSVLILRLCAIFAVLNIHFNPPETADDAVIDALDMAL